MIIKFILRLLKELDNRALKKLIINAGFKGAIAISAFKKRLRSGEVFPPTLFISLTTKCNLNCIGCWASPGTEAVSLDPMLVDRIISSAKNKRCSFFGLLGGEPLLWPHLLQVIEKHPDCYFQVFTNGTLFNTQVADAFRRLGNVSPLFSIEGLNVTAAKRRGKPDVFDQTIEAVKLANQSGLFTGVASSICTQNFDELVNEEYVNTLVSCGAHYIWFYIYRPAGINPGYELALAKDQILMLRKFLVEVRSKVPALIIDAYWDYSGKSICPAAEGISHHINAAGFVEPCPVIQFAKDNLNLSHNPAETIQNSDFLKRFRAFALKSGGGCVFLKSPQTLSAFLKETGALDTTGRNTGFSELERLPIMPDHSSINPPVPEKHWFYKFVKKNWFFGLGTYG
jgi:MoaA/NifB/PqqE/SkfB family radical SAM enzyme